MEYFNCAHIVLIVGTVGGINIHIMGKWLFFTLPMILLIPKLNLLF